MGGARTKRSSSIRVYLVLTQRTRRISSNFILFFFFFFSLKKKRWYFIETPHLGGSLLILARRRIYQMKCKGGRSNLRRRRRRRRISNLIYDRQLNRWDCVILLLIQIRNLDDYCIRMDERVADCIAVVGRKATLLRTAHLLTQVSIDATQWDNEKEKVIQFSKAASLLVERQRLSVGRATSKK